MKGQLPRSFIIFSIAVILVGVLTLFEFPCPVDQGTGIILAAKDLKVESVELKPVSVKIDYTFSECGVPVQISKFTYEVDMLLKNEDTEPSHGIVLVKFFNDNAGKVYDKLGQPVEMPTPRLFVDVDIPATTAEHIKKVLSFTGLPLEPETGLHRVTVEMTRDQPDPTCGGTGKLPFVDFLKVIMSR